MLGRINYMDNKSARNQAPVENNSKQEQLDQYRVQNAGKAMTSNQGRKISNDEDQLKDGDRGRSLRQYYELFEIITNLGNKKKPEHEDQALGTGDNIKYVLY